MRFGCVVPWATEPEFVELAALAERSGWDAIFTWEAVWGQDAWCQLAAAAVRTERIRLGTLLTPASRYRPWDLATRVGSVDRLSGGRVTMSVGLGAQHDNWLAFEPPEPRATRAAKLDECLAVYAGLMRGQPFSYAGRHHGAKPVELLAPPPPVQRPHPPVWVVGALRPDATAQPSLDRAARWEGILPTVAIEGHRLTPEDLARILEHIRARRAEWGLDGAYDVVLEGDTFGGFTAAPGSCADWAAHGATWWVESWWDLADDPAGRAQLRSRVESGPHGGHG